MIHEYKYTKKYIKYFFSKININKYKMYRQKLMYPPGRGLWLSKNNNKILSF